MYDGFKTLSWVILRKDILYLILRGVLSTHLIVALLLAWRRASNNASNIVKRNQRYL